MVDLHKHCGSPKEREKIKARLTEAGGEVLGLTNMYEKLRFRTKFGVGVVYQRATGRFTANEEAKRALEALLGPPCGSLAPVPVTPRRRAIGEKRRGEIERIIERDGGACFFCGGRMTDLDRAPAPGRDVTIEHLVPRAHGGPEHISNKFAAHKCCNELAGHLSAPEKIALRDRLRNEPQAVAA